MATQFLTLSDTQKRLLSAVKERMSNPQRSLRELCRKHNVSYGRLHRALKQPPTGAGILEASSGRGRRRRLTPAGEELIKETIIEFQSNGTPLDRRSVQDLVQEYVKTLPMER